MSGIKRRVLVFIFVLLYMSILLCACSSNNSIEQQQNEVSSSKESEFIGRWETESGSYCMTFYEGGKGDCNEGTFNWWLSEGDGYEYLNIEGIDFTNKKGRMIYHITDDMMVLRQTYNNNKIFKTLYKK